MKKRKSVIYFSIIGVLLIIIVTYAITYAWFTQSINGGTISVATSKTLDIDYINGSDIINGVIIPTSTYTNGMNTNIQFKNKANSLQGVCSLKLQLITFPSTLKSVHFKWALYKNNEETSTINGNFNNVNQGDVMTLLNNYYANNTYDRFTLYIWLDGENATNTMQNQNFSAKFYVEVTQTNKNN